MLKSVDMGCGLSERLAGSGGANAPAGKAARPDSSLSGLAC
jgi:hypothetical protein